MKILIIGDLHIWDEYKIGYNKDGKNSRLEDFNNAFNAINTNIINNKPDVVISVGDLFHKRRHDALTTKYVGKFLKNLNSFDNLKIINVGNHDQTDSDGKNNYVRPLIGLANDNFVCPNINGSIKIKNNTAFFIIPYTKKNFIDKAKFLLKKNINLVKSKYKILVMHQDIKGMKWEAITAKKGIEKDELRWIYKNFNFIINGHHHIREIMYYNTLLKGINTGITIPIDFKSNDIKPHIDLLIIKESIPKIVNLPLNNLPIFFVQEILADKILNTDKIKNFKNVYLKIILNGTKRKIDEWIEKYKKFYDENKNIMYLKIEPIYFNEKKEYSARIGMPIDILIEKYILENDGNLDNLDYALHKMEVV